MRVEGSTPADAVQATRPEPTVVKVRQSRTAPTGANVLLAREARLSSGATVQATTRVLRQLRDTYQHESSAPSTPAAYTPSGEANEAPRVISSAFESTRSAVAEAPKAEIAGLKTTANARGLPLISEPYTDGPVYGPVFEAYKETGGAKDGAPGEARPHEIFDTLG